VNNTNDEDLNKLREAAARANEMGDSLRALELYEKIISSKKHTAPDFIEYCSCLKNVGRDSECLSKVLSAAREENSDWRIRVLCGNLHFNEENYEIAIESFLSYLNINEMPINYLMNSLPAIIITMIYGPLDDPELLSSLIQEWHDLYIKTNKPLKLERRGLNSKIRVAFVNNHFAVSAYYSLAMGMIPKINPTKIDVYCYNFGPMECSNTIDFPKHIVFRDLAKLDDDAVIRTIQLDKIDILIDMNGFDSTNRWGVYTRRPAPIMMSWYNVFSPMGGNTFDYIIMDQNICTEKMKKHFYEEVLYLPCWTTMKPSTDAPEIVEAPCLTNGYITFACFNRPSKLNSKVFLAWSHILDEVPNSILYLRNARYANNYTHDWIMKLILNAGIDPGRVRIEGPSSWIDFISAYGDADIALDPFPFNGGITSLEALWQGLPVVSIQGQSWGARLGAMMLSGTNCTEWMTSYVDEYIDLAIALASDPVKLNQIRLGLRARLSSSPIMDGDANARAMETLLLQAAEKFRSENPELGESAVRNT